MGYIRTPDGNLEDFSPSKHTVLRDDASGKMMVYARTPDTDASRLESAGRVMSLGMLEPVTRGVRGALTAPGKMASNLADFDTAGVRPPTLGTVTEGRGTRIIEETGRNNPLTGKQFERADERALGDLTAAVDNTAGKYGTANDPYAIGETVRQGIDKYKVRLEQTGERLFDPVHRAIGDTSPVGLDSTKTFLDAESARFADFPEIADFLKSPQVERVRSALSGSDELPYSLLKDLRTQVGKRMRSRGLMDDREEALLKGLYGSLTDDMKQAASSAGVLDKFNRANKVWSGEMDRVKGLNKLYDKAQERIASDVSAMAKGGTSRSSYEALRSLFGALKGDERKEVASGLIRTLGLSKANDMETFSPTRFFKSFDAMDPKSRDLLFGTANNELRRELNGLVRVAKTLDKADRVKQRPNTAVPAMGMGTVAAVGSGLYFSPELTALAAVSGAAAAKLLTSPRFIRLVRYAAENGTPIPPQRLGLIARDLPQQADAIRQFQSALAEQEQGASAR